MGLPRHSNPEIEAVLRKYLDENGVVHLTIEAQAEIDAIMAEEYGREWAFSYRSNESKTGDEGDEMDGR